MERRVGKSKEQGGRSGNGLLDERTLFSVEAIWIWVEGTIFLRFMTHCHDFNIGSWNLQLFCSQYHARTAPCRCSRDLLDVLHRYPGLIFIDTYEPLVLAGTIESYKKLVYSTCNGIYWTDYCIFNAYLVL